MAIEEVNGQPWRRKHDNPDVAVIASAPRTLYPQGLEDLIKICANRAPAERIHAAGSHWALSEAAISDSVFVETHDPYNGHPGMAKTLYEVVPPCLNPEFIAGLTKVTVKPFDKAPQNVSENEGLYPVHIETGKRIYELYNELDEGDTNPASLANLIASTNGSYLGEWAFPTLGGAGGQTVFGALTTGTHGGDFRKPPLADVVLALHLVVDGGRHYWIEREVVSPFGVPLTIDGPLRNLYGQPKFWGRIGPNNFNIIRDDSVFNSALISVGRFGIVYSIVIGAVRQYSLHQQRRLTTWSDIKSQVADVNSPLYNSVVPQSGNVGPLPNRFLQVVVSITPHLGFTANRAGVTKRWNVARVDNPDTQEPAGRRERGGDMAGASHAYSPDPDHPGLAQSPNFLERVCAHANFLDGVLVEVIGEIGDFIKSKGAIAGPVLVAMTVAGSGLLELIPPLAVILAALLAFLALFRLSSGESREGQVFNDIRDTLLNRTNSAEKLAGLLVWQMISYAAFANQQGDSDFSAISYAVMDGHDYLDQSCNVNVDSIEVFFDATDPMLIAFIDALLAFEVNQEVVFGRAFVGYISMRFVAQSAAPLAPEQFPLTCAVEVAGLRDVDGVTQLINYAIQQALDSNFNAILHWGQRNESNRAQIEDRFPDVVVDPPFGPLRTWRNTLSLLTNNGSLDGFSSAFTRRTGLEIVSPLINTFTASLSDGTIIVSWDCTSNPPLTQVRLVITYPDGSSSSLPGLPLQGKRYVPANSQGFYRLQLTAAIDLDGMRNESYKQQVIQIGTILK